MDKVSKFLLKVSRKEREGLIPIMRDIISGEVMDLDCKKLKGRKDEYRVRVGKVRVIFRRLGGQNVIIDVRRRDENTY